jgi:hypothetical protein
VRGWQVDSSELWGGVCRCECRVVVGGDGWVGNGVGVEWLVVVPVRGGVCGVGGSCVVEVSGGE